ncbi:hypothetical protein [Kribbella sp. NPDC051718]|uniref:hypothetical protein n=1 Tax=Kribbella sp. NPDC051718 TaxID=3155168 RepID=UPI00342B05C7
MQFLATATITKPEQLVHYAELETAVLNQLRAEGTVTSAYRYTAKHGVVGIFQHDSLASLKAEIERLPFVSEHLMTFAYDEIVEL